MAHGFPGFPMPGGGMPGGMPPRMPMNPDPASAWQEFTAADGRKYYFNMITQENTWEKPKVLIDREGFIFKLYSDFYHLF